jgi:hypothetical protein
VIETHKAPSGLAGPRMSLSGPLRGTVATADDVPVARAQRLTRAERRGHRATVPVSEVYGVDATDAGAESWIGRYLCWADSADAARARARNAGFHHKHIRAQWTPSQKPPPGIPAELQQKNDHWYRSRFNDSGWTSWERLPADYRHPPQGLAAQDPSVR